MVNAEARVHAPFAQSVGVGESGHIRQLPLLAVEDEAKLRDGCRPLRRQVVRRHGEQAPAREVREQVLAAQRRNRPSLVGIAAADGVAFVVVVLRHRIDERLGIRRRPRIHRAVPAESADAALGGERALAPAPAVVGAALADVQLLDLVLADVGEEHSPVRVPGELLRMAQAVGPNLLRRAGAADERIVRRDAVGAPAAGVQRVDAGDGAERRVQPLAVVVRIVAAAAVAEADVQQAVVRHVRRRGGIEGDGADVVIRRELAHAQHFPGGAAEHVGAGVRGGPLADDAVLHGAGGGVIRGAAARRGAEGGVQLAVAGRVRIGELGMEREAEEPGLVGKSGVAEAHVAAAQVQVHGGRTAIGVHQIQHAAHVVEREPPALAGRRRRHRQQVLNARVGVIGAARTRRIERARRARERRRAEQQIAFANRLRDRIRKRLRERRRRERQQQGDGRVYPCPRVKALHGHSPLRVPRWLPLPRKPGRPPPAAAANRPPASRCP